MDTEHKIDVEHEELREEGRNKEHVGGLAAFAVGSERVHLTSEQSQMICRKIDKNILPLLMWVYFLQILDKSCIGYGATFGLQAEAGLVGTQYSLIGSAGYWAQLGIQPFSAYLIVKVPARILMPILVVCWGASMIGLAFSRSYIPLIVFRFFLGLFEAGCLPLFSVITTKWYRRSEQPLRIALWYGTNGVASILGSLLAFALSFIVSPTLYVYQILFLVVGLATVLTGPLIIWKLDNNPAEARFLSEEERLWAVERLRDNNTGIETRTFKWSQAGEAVLSPLIWLFIGITFCINCGASVTNTFGPLIIKGFGFSSRQTILLNMPFGFLQVCAIASACYLASRFKRKGIMILAYVIPCIIGSGLLYGLGRGAQYQGALLFSYYIIASLFACNPLILSWMAANISGYSKKSLAFSMYNAGSAVGNIVGPLLFVSTDAPYYFPGLRSVLGIFVACLGCTGLVWGLLIWYNKKKEADRVKVGKPAKIADLSMESKYRERVDDPTVNGVRLGDNGLADMTDRENDEFVYAY